MFVVFMQNVGQLREIEGGLQYSLFQVVQDWVGLRSLASVLLSPVSAVPCQILAPIFFCCAFIAVNQLHCLFGIQMISKLFESISGLIPDFSKVLPLFREEKRLNCVFCLPFSLSNKTTNATRFAGFLRPSDGINFLPQGAFMCLGWETLPCYTAHFGKRLYT